MAQLNADQRVRLPSRLFALSGRRYPIHDENHAKAALARVEEFGTLADQVKVREAVRARYPDMDVEGGDMRDRLMTMKKSGKLSKK